MANLHINGQTLFADDKPTSLGVNCPHDEVGRHDIGRKYYDSQETVHWQSQTSALAWHDSMGHYSQVQL